MGRWKSKEGRNVEESVNIYKKKYVNVKKKNCKKIENKKEIYIDIKIGKNEYVKLIIYIYINIYIYIYIFVKKIWINNK